MSITSRRRPQRHESITSWSAPNRKAPLYAAFRHEGYEARYGGGPGKPIGHVILFTADGRLVPFYQNANWIQGEFTDVNADGTVENVQAGRIGACCPVSYGATVLRVIPIVADPLPLLCVAYNPQYRKTDQWSWRVADTNGDDILEIQLGPVLKIHGDPGMNLHDDGRNKAIDPVVTYTWSTKHKAYVGPDGGNRDPFKRISPTNQSAELKEFSIRAKKASAEPAN